MNDKRVAGRYRFAFVSNSSEIADVVKAFANPETEEMVVRLATMEKAVPVAKALLDDGIEVIMGGGGTGSLLARTIGQPVIKIARTHLDVITALMDAKKHGEYIALTCFKEAAHGLEIFENLLSIKIRQIVFITTNELKNGIAAAVREGVDCVVGGGICRKIAGSLGCEGVIVLPSEEVVSQALHEARAVAAARRKEAEYTRQLQTILQIIKEGVIVVDNTGRIKTFNQMAADILGIELDSATGKSLSEAVKGTGLLQVLSTGRPEFDQIRRVGGINIVINSLPIQMDGKNMGAVATFKEAERIQAIDRKVREQLYCKGFVAKYTIDQMASDNPAMKQLVKKAEKYTRTDETIMIQGETGSGKEFLAHSLHNLSRRKRKTFVAINCSALQETLLESELFGYEEGAFTGAKKGGKIGLFELASGGTLFLDEIADISTGLQVRLLRVLETKEVMRVGGDRYVPVDVRIIISTNKDLSRQVRKGNFRRDLFFRLSVLKLNLPPLKERPEDIEKIALALLKKYSNGAKRISGKAMAWLRAYPWPGNIRELDSFVKIYVILLGDTPSSDHLVRELLHEFRSEHRVVASGDGFQYNELPEITTKTLRDRVAAFEVAVIRQVLAGHNRRESARHLGISVNTLWRKLKN